MIRVGTAGWALPPPVRDRFPPGPTLLQRYAALLPAVEINSSFYRPHRAVTYARWAGAVPDHFRFSVKLPRALTHEARLVGTAAPVAAFLSQVPPSLSFDERAAGNFFDLLGESRSGPVACEPRHPTWFEPAADDLPRSRRVARVAADPAVVPAAGEPGGWCIFDNTAAGAATGQALDLLARLPENRLS